MTENTIEAKKIAKETEEWAAKQKLLQMSEISMVLHTYDDIFSDFDPRPIEKRALSDDFLTEIKRSTKENKPGLLEVNFLIPTELRNNEKEIKIRKRLHEYFRKHYETSKNDILHIRKTGAKMVAIGFAVGVIGAIFLIPGEYSVNPGIELLQKTLLILIEPASWFTIWNGFDKIFATWKVMKPDREFYKKMSKSEINFTGY